MTDDERLPDEVLAKIREALEQSERGEVVDLGDFTQYLDNQDVMSPTEELEALLIAHEPFNSADFIEVPRPGCPNCGGRTESSKYIIGDGEWLTFCTECAWDDRKTVVETLTVRLSPNALNDRWTVETALRALAHQFPDQFEYTITKEIR